MRDLLQDWNSKKMSFVLYPFRGMEETRAIDVNLNFLGVPIRTVDLRIWDNEMLSSISPLAICCHRFFHLNKIGQKNG